LYRYLILIWNRADAAATTAAHLVATRARTASVEWAPILDEPGLIAFHSGAGQGSSRTRIISRPPNAAAMHGERDGAVFGTLFRRGRELEAREAANGIEPSESARIVATRASHLVDHYWGRYVAVVADESRREISLLRDPTGALPCFLTSYRGVSVVFSEMESALALGLLPFSINWKYVASFVPYGALQIRETGLREVSEVQAGERLIFKEGRVERGLLWNPVQIAQESRIENPAEAVAAVRTTLKTCVHAWASLHDAVIHNLSGGLDSSIVLACLKDAPTHPSITCLHYFSPSSNEDERQYARLAAGHMNADLVEHGLDAATISLERILQIRLAPKPWFYIYDLVHSPIEAQLSADKNATGVFSGSGGDALFLQARAELAVADFLRNHGFRTGAFRVALNAARITRTSMWPILGHGLLRHLKPPARSVLGDVAQMRSLVPPAIFESARSDDSLIHPWIRGAPNISPGLLWHILCLAVPSPFYESFGGTTDIERTVVLMSQPLIELCLRIPSYVWITGGRDRAIARRAFADMLPAAITRRTQKGAIDRHNRMLLDQNEGFVREMLLDGLMVQNGLLDRERLELYIGREHSPAGFEYNEVLRQHLCTEIWLRRWSQIERRAAAA